MLPSEFGRIANPKDKMRNTQFDGSRTSTMESALGRVDMRLNNSELRGRDRMASTEMESLRFMQNRPAQISGPSTFSQRKRSQDFNPMPASPYTPKQKPKLQKPVLDTENSRDETH